MLVHVEVLYTTSALNLGEISHHRNYRPPSSKVSLPSSFLSIQPISSPTTLETHLFSKFPNPTFQNPYAQIAVAAPKITAPPGPLIGKLRLYLIDSYPPGGGISLLTVSAHFTQRKIPRNGIEGEPKTYCLKPCDMTATPLWLVRYIDFRVEYGIRS